MHRHGRSPRLQCRGFSAVVVLIRLKLIAEAVESQVASVLDSGFKEQSRTRLKR